MKTLKTFSEPEIEIIFVTSEDICSASPTLNAVENGNPDERDWGSMWT